MAPGPGARPGWSRRAQYGLFFSFLAAIAGLLIGLALLALSLVAPTAYASVRGAALDVTAPVTGALRGVTDTVAGLFTGAGNYWDAARQNSSLREENGKLRRQSIQARAIFGENAQLKAVLALREKEVATVATGRIVGSSLESERRFAVITAGSGDGVSVGMPVRSAEGLIGRVIDSGLTASRVLLVSDRSNIVPARLLRGGQPVIATGRGDGTIDLRPLEVGRNPFKRGDLIVTSGTGGLYPPNVPIARVIRLDDDGAIALPMADPAKVSFAVVGRPYEEAALPEAAPSSAESPAATPPAGAG
ncbi:rod shape-determining protein MreC [Sphingomonas glaciei]|uniref:Cell shape-determining protein MreC n=1 Tax=Sphingomonas glaciei TaxID=2938948 RepID=A0ABY5MWH7_9SPHN|nr:rod shape-determining protein MreC [Sphingomonas glaciei]UUR08467.1 rod shape-determining protein MreC [Sphingomonas glaciei]